MLTTNSIPLLHIIVPKLRHVLRASLKMCKCTITIYYTDQQEGILLYPPSIHVK